MHDKKQSHNVCMQCNLPFKTEDSLNLHISNWHNSGKSPHKVIDPVQVLWQNLVHRIFETTDGFQGLSETEKRYFAVNILVGEICNGGFDQFFFNSSGSYYKYVVLGLEEMNAHETLALLQQAKLVAFNDEEIPENTSIRREFLLEHESDARLQILYALDKQFYTDPDDLNTKTNTYAKLHGLL